MLTQCAEHVVEREPRHAAWRVFLPDTITYPNRSSVLSSSLIKVQDDDSSARGLAYTLYASHIAQQAKGALRGAFCCVMSIRTALLKVEPLLLVDINLVEPVVLYVFEGKILICIPILLDETIRLCVEVH